jgi:3-oxoacyl-[acyl-carrier protein] reductase
MTTDRLVVIVTGGSRGLGLAIVESLLIAGYRVATCSRKTSSEIDRLNAEHGGAKRFMWRQCNLGDESEEENFINSVSAWAAADGLYALVNNAAITGEGVLATFPTVEIERILQVNLVSAIRLARLVLRVLLGQGRPGRIVNISSIVGSRGYTGLAAYGASKAGLDGLSRALAREVGRRGITVNSVAPGYLETELSATLNDQQRRQIVNRTPLGRLGTVGDIAPLVTFLLSEPASFITGQTLVVDGGISC